MGSTRGDVNAQARSFWSNRYATDWNLGPGVGSRGEWKRLKQHQLQAACTRYAARSLLDLGCGDLRILSDLKEFDRLEYVGVDFVPEVIEANRQKYPTKKFICQDLRDACKTFKRQFDIIACFDVLFHIEDDETYDELCRFMYEAEAKCIILTATVGQDLMNATNIWARDFWGRLSRLGFDPGTYQEFSYRLPHERLFVFERQP